MALEPNSYRDLGERAHRVGLLVNGSLAFLKIAAGTAAGSPALLADGYHSLADLATNGGAWLSFRVALRPPDADHHYGHGKLEAVAGFAIGAILAAMGAAMVVGSWSAGAPQYATSELTYIALTAVISIALNGWLARYTARAADTLQSPALRALSLDNRSDALSSFVVLAGIGAGQIGVGVAEAVVSFVIGLSVFRMGWRTLRENLGILTDRFDDPELVERLGTLAAETAGVVAVQSVRVHPLGARLRVDMEISVAPELTVSKGHAIAHAAETRITQEVERVVQVAVHVNPAAHP